MSRLSIRKKDGDIIPFVLNHCQKVVFDTLKKKEEAGEPLWVIILKARRVGISTLTEGLLTAHCFATPNARVRIIAHKHNSSEALFEVAKRMRDSVRVHMPPGTQRVLRYPYTDAILQIQTAGSTTSGRGLSLSGCHFSEGAFYPGDAESLTSVLPAIPRKEGTIVVIESTANGKIGDGKTFFDLWTGAIEERNAFSPVFIPWTMDPDCVADEEFAEDAPSDDEEERLMASGVTREQLAWRRMTIETECKGLVEVFHQEFPRNWEEAFVSTGSPAFNEIERKHAAIYLNPPYSQKPYAQLLPVRDEAGSDGRIPHTCQWIEDKQGIVMWEKPKEAHRYYLGADVARAKTTHSDFSALVIWNGTTGDQVARFAERIDPFKLADIIDLVGRKYNNAMAIVEINSMGGWCQKQLRDIYKYPNMYRWKGGKDDALPGKGVRQALGWETTYNSRRLLLGAFREALRYKEIQLFDPMLLAQIEAATYDEDWRWELEIGHDDILVAAMLAVIAMKQYPPAKRLGSRIIDYELGAAEKAESDGQEEAFQPRFELDPRWALKRHFNRIHRKKGKMDRLAGI